MIALSILIMAATAALFVLVNPSAMRHVAAWLMARVEAKEAYRDTSAGALTHWRGVLGVGPTYAELRRRAG